jgi:hypothetical protein
MHGLRFSSIVVFTALVFSGSVGCTSTPPNAFHSAVLLGSVAELEKAQASGADINGHGNNGDTPLHLAARAGKLSSANTLLARGADALAQNKQGQTALDIAMEMKRADIAQAVMIAAAQQKAAAAGVEAPGFNKWKPLGKPGAPAP